jgi:hypothetical protein
MKDNAAFRQMAAHRATVDPAPRRARLGNGLRTEPPDIWRFSGSGANSPDVWRIPATRSLYIGRLNQWTRKPEGSLWGPLQTLNSASDLLGNGGSPSHGPAEAVILRCARGSAVLLGARAGAACQAGAASFRFLPPASSPAVASFGIQRRVPCWGALRVRI